MLSEKYEIQKIITNLDTFSPFDLAEVDKEYVVRIAYFKGAFPFHTHPKDEFFLVLEGNFTLETKESKTVLNQGECITVRGGLEHRPSCENRAIVLTVMHKSIRTSKANFPEVKDKL
jgi:mannose-6-phosphate isomerase-like protein (cupin superfamily)